jgi:gluconate 2-dehydrogenase gamma chain
MTETGRLPLAGQGPSRRELLQALTLASAAATFSGFSRWSHALAEQHTLQPAYRPQFFSPAQYQTVEQIAELILPSTHDAAGKALPGAREAGVVEFIDFMVFSDPSLQPEFLHGLRWLDHAAAPAPTFSQLSSAQQHALLERLAYKAHQRETEKAGQQFFRLIRRYTVIGFYTTRIGLESLDYPGLKFYATSPGCTHSGNPEHVGL